MKKGLITLAAACAALSVQAADPTLAELQKQLKELSAKIEQLEKQQTQKMEAMEKQNADQIAQLKADNSVKIKELEESAEPMELPEWVKTTKIKGDFRYRYENREDDKSTAKDRQRVRGRIGVYGKVNDFIDYGVRFAMEESATSGNNTLGDNFQKEGAYFDRFYVDIHPNLFKGTHLVLGKMPQPWLARTGLLWDSDLNPEGVAAVYSKDLEENLTLHANAGAFVVEEDLGDDVRLQSAQVAFDAALGGAKVQIGASDYWFENLENSSITGTSWKNITPNGNFNIVEGFGSVSVKAGKLPVKFYGQVANNTEAENSEEDTAYLVGVKLGKAKEPGDWEVGYNWREIGKDSVFGPLNDSDFNDGNTDSRGHKFSAKYQIAKNWQAGLTYFMTEGAVADMDTLQADLKFKF